ncbi:MAG: hypothetical protein AB8B78_02785 [Polaribacter sp.]
MKFKILLLLTFITLFSSCETDNTTNIAITEADLLGTWQVKEQTLKGTITYTISGITNTVDYDAYAKDISMTLTFNDTPKKVSASGKYTLVATSSFLGQPITEEELVEADTNPAQNPTWALNGNNLTMSNDNNIPQNLIVESYDGKILRLKAEIDEPENSNSQDVNIKTTIYFVLEK